MMNVEDCHFASLFRRASLTSIVSVLVVLCGVSYLSGEARGQILRVEQTDPAPPPLKFIPDSDKTQLAAVLDMKERTKLSLELAEARLLRAEVKTNASDYTGAAAELGVYEAIVSDVISFLQKNSRQNNKTRDLFKRIDLALRKHGPRIEMMRRTTPAEDAVNVRHAYEFVRHARAESLNGFYGDTVLREKDVHDNDEAKNDEAASERPDKVSAPQTGSAAQPAQKADDEKKP